MSLAGCCGYRGGGPGARRDAVVRLQVGVQRFEGGFPFLVDFGFHSLPRKPELVKR